MKATQFEFRFRLWIGFTIYLLAFWAPWLRYGRPPAPVSTTWLELSGVLARWLPLETASIVVTVASILFALFATGFRISGTAYIGSPIVHSRTMHAPKVVAAGPYRYVRNPLYLGSFLFVVSMSILMPPSGALFAVAATFLLVLRLILREESFLETQQGEPYLAYKHRVPRLLPSPVPRVSPSPAQPQWRSAVIAENFFLTMTGCLLILAWRYNATLLTQALLICFGLSMVVRAFLKKA